MSNVMEMAALHHRKEELRGNLRTAEKYPKLRGYGEAEQAAWSAELAKVDAELLALAESEQARIQVQLRQYGGGIPAPLNDSQQKAVNAAQAAYDRKIASVKRAVKARILEALEAAQQLDSALAANGSPPVIPTGTLIRNELFRIAQDAIDVVPEPVTRPVLPPGINGA